MHAFHNLPHLCQTLQRSLDEEQSFPRGFHSSFPSINGFHSARKYIHASGEPCAHHCAPNASRLGRSGTCHQNYKFVGQDFLQARYSFSIPAHPIWLSLACHATILRWRHDRYYYKPSHKSLLCVAASAATSTRQ